MEDLLKHHGLEFVRVLMESPSTGRGLYQVKQPTLGLAYALKRVPISRERQKYVRNEITAFNRLPFGLAPHCHRLFENNGFAYLLLDWIDGTSVAELFKTPPADKDDLVRRLRVLNLIARGLDRVHASGVIHRDIKPDNVIVSDDVRNPKAIHLIDFGLSVQDRLYEEGTVGYRAPEQEINRGLSITKVTDIYGVGQTGWYLLTAQPLLRTPNAQYNDWDLPVMPFLPSFIPKVLVEILERATAFNPRMRFPRAMDLAMDLNRVADNLGRTR